MSLYTISFIYLRKNELVFKKIICSLESETKGKAF